jgi:hypothetical protein
MKNKKLNPEGQEMLEVFETGEFESDFKEECRTQLAKNGYVLGSGRMSTFYQ